MTTDRPRRLAQQRRAQARYEQTPKGKAAKARYNRRRIWLTQRRMIGVATTEAQARAIGAHIKERKREFTSAQHASKP